VQYLGEILPALQANIHEALRAVKLSGRYQQIHTNPQIIVDVAHNPQAAKSLAQNLQSHAGAGKTLAVLGMLADKDIAGVINAVAPEIDAWYLADIHSPRGAKAIELQELLLNRTLNLPIQTFASVSAAIESACKNSAKNDRIIVFGSFYTVADAIASKFNSLRD
jgi:dihydrofolate synthase/folylpolyglutamate synthase